LHTFSSRKKYGQPQAKTTSLNCALHNCRHQGKSEASRRRKKVLLRQNIHQLCIARLFSLTPRFNVKKTSLNIYLRLGKCAGCPGLIKFRQINRGMSKPGRKIALDNNMRLGR
jgi:hypothetical protein